MKNIDILSKKLLNIWHNMFSCCISTMKKVVPSKSEGLVPKYGNSFVKDITAVEAPAVCYINITRL